MLSEAEEQAFEVAFEKFDKHRCGKLELHSFHELCHSLDLHLDISTAQSWLGKLAEVDGLTLEEVKLIGSGILAGQTPAVRKSAAGQSLGLSDLRATESYMRGAFQQHAADGSITVDALRELFRFLAFPDIYGDGFDRFVGEWLLLAGKPAADEEPLLNVHDFISCVNLLVDVCQAHQEAEEQRPHAPTL